MKLKVKSLLEQYQWVYSQDDAYDYDREGWLDAYDKFKESGDLDLLAPFAKDGHKPAIFTLRHLTPRQRRYAADVAIRDGHLQAAYEATRLALVSIAVPDDEAPEIKHTSGKNGWDFVDEEWIAMLDGAAAGLVTELGMHVLQKEYPSKN